MEEEFEILAAKVLGGEASPKEQARLEELLIQSAALREEYAGLKAAWAALKAAGPIAHALGAEAAPIPEQRLRQLQQVVREKAQAASAATASQKRSHGRSPGHESSVGLGALWRWLQRRTGVSPVPFFVAALAVLWVIGIAFWFFQPEKTGTPVIVPHETSAYLLVQQGPAEVIRAGKALRFTETVGLSQADELRLAPAARATLLTPTGTVAIAGPLRSPVSSLVPGIGQPGSNVRPEPLQIALFRPAPELLAAGLLVTTRGGQGIPLYSPLGATANLTPLILWKSEPGKTYDVTIIDEFEPKTPAWRLANAISPVEFANVEAWRGRTLAKDGLYRLRINETGRPLTASEYTFRTAEAAGRPSFGEVADPFAQALQILTTTPSCVGDALALLLHLPPEQANTEPVLRLKLFLFGQLGYQADFRFTLARLQTDR